MNIVKSILTWITGILAVCLFVSINYIFAFNFRGGMYLLVLELIVAMAGVGGYFLRKKTSFLWIALFSNYTIATLYLIGLYFFRETIFIDCDLFCFAPVLVSIQYLFFLPVLSIPLFNMIIKNEKNALRWRNNYKIIVIVVYLVLLPAMYFSIRGR